MYMQGLPIEKVGMEGEGLVFVVYSDAIASMPGKNAVSGQLYHSVPGQLYKNIYLTFV